MRKMWRKGGFRVRKIFFVNATFFGTKDTQMRRIVFWYLFWLSWKCITNADHFWTLLDEDSPLGGIQKNGLRSVFLMSSFLATCGTKSDVIWWFPSSVFFRWKHAETLGWRNLGEPSSYKCQLPYGKTLGTYHCVTSNPRNLPNLYVYEAWRLIRAWQGRICCVATVIWKWFQHCPQSKLMK